MKAEELKAKLDSLSEILMEPWFMAEHVTTFRGATVDLHSAMKKYHEYLTKMNVRANKNHHLDEG